MIKRLASGVALVSLLSSAFFYYEGHTGASASPFLANLQSTPGNIHLALVENDYEGPRTVETGKVDMVWAAEDQWKPANDPAPGVVHDFYDYFSRDSQVSSHHDFTWMQANHPDWIEYACDRTTPLHGNGWTALDFTNPTVQAYQLGILEEAMDGGYNGVSFDVTDTFNYQHYCGHYDANGNWVQQFSGQTVDQTYRQAYVQNFATFTRAIRQQAVNRGISFTIGINPALDTWKPVDQVADLFPYVDVLFDEEGFTLGGGESYSNKLLADSTDYESSEWGQNVKWLQDFINAGKAVIIADNENYTVDVNNPPRPADVNWVLANYLLVKGQYTYQAPMTSAYRYGGNYYQDPAYKAPIGDPTDSMYQWQGIYRRDFTGGLALVNPSPSTGYTVALPAGTYTDVNGTPVSSPVNLPAGGSGLALLRTGSVPTATTTPPPTSTPAPTNTPSPTSTPRPTNTPVPTSTPFPTSTPSPTSTPRPTNTPVPTSTPRPTSTPIPTSTPVSEPPPPSPRLGSNLVTNGSFEDGSGWSGTPVAANGLTETSNPHSGSYAVQLCPAAGLCNQFLWQQVALPTSMDGATLSYWVDIVPTGGACTSTLSVQLSDLRNTPLSTTYTHCDASMAGRWTHVQVDVSSALQSVAGGRIQLIFRALNTGYSHNLIYLDDVTLTP